MSFKVQGSGNLKIMRRFLGTAQESLESASGYVWVLFEL